MSVLSFNNYDFYNVLFYFKTQYCRPYFVLCRRFGYIPYILSPFGVVAVLTFAVLVCRRFDQAPSGCAWSKWRQAKMAKVKTVTPKWRQSQTVTG